MPVGLRLIFALVLTAPAWTPRSLLAQTAPPAPPAPSSAPGASSAPDRRLNQVLRKAVEEGHGAKPLVDGATAQAPGGGEAAALPHETAGGQIDLRGPANERRSLGPASGEPLATGGASQASDGGGWLYQTLAALAAVVGLIFLARAAIGRAMGQSAPAARSPVVEVLTRVTIAPRSHIVLLRIGQRILVAGDSQAGLRTLATIDDPEEIAALLSALTAGKAGSPSAGFAHLMSRFNGDYERDHQTQDEGGDDEEVKVDRARDHVSRLLSRVRSLAGGGERP